MKNSTYISIAIAYAALFLSNPANALGKCAKILSTIGSGSFAQPQMVDHTDFAQFGLRSIEAVDYAGSTIVFAIHHRVYAIKNGASVPFETHATPTWTDAPGGPVYEQSHVAALAATPDGKYLLSGGMDPLKLTGVGSGVAKPMWSVPDAGTIINIQITQDGKQASVLYQQSAFLVSIPDGRILGRI